MEKEVCRSLWLVAFSRLKRGVKLKFRINARSQIRTGEVRQSEAAETAETAEVIRTFTLVCHGIKTGGPGSFDRGKWRVIPEISEHLKVESLGTD